MSVGHATSKSEIDARASEIAARFQSAFNDAITLQGYLAATPDPDLIALGYTADDVATLKTAYGDLAQLAKIWAGTEALPAPKDFRIFVSRLWGMGAF